jgi:hypothetical protein
MIGRLGRLTKSIKQYPKMKILTWLLVGSFSCASVLRSEEVRDLLSPLPLDYTLIRSIEKIYNDTISEDEQGGELMAIVWRTRAYDLSFALTMPENSRSYDMLWNWFFKGMKINHWSEKTKGQCCSKEKITLPYMLLG